MVGTGVEGGVQPFDLAEQVQPDRPFQNLFVVVGEWLQECREAVQAVVLVAVLGIEQTWDVIDPAVEGDAGPERSTESMLERRPHQLSVMVARHHVQRATRLQEPGQRVEHLGVSFDHPVEGRQCDCLAHRFRIRVRHQLGTEEVDEVTEHHQPKPPLLSHVVEEAGECVVVVEGLDALRRPRPEMQVADDDEVHPRL